MTKIIKKYPKAELETCEQKGHEKGCYIRLTDEPVTHSNEVEVLIDYDKNNEIVGVDLLR